MKTRARAGIGLLEVLIAITLVSILSVGMLMALQMGLRTMEKVDARLYDNRRVIAVNRIIDSQIAGLIPVAAHCTGGGDGMGPKIAFFQGEATSMRFVSSYSMQDASRGYPQLLEYTVIRNEQGALRIVVNEQFYAPQVALGTLCLGMQPNPLMPDAGPVPRFLPIRVGPASFVLADKLQRVRFLYREALTDPPYERWHVQWPKHDKLPSAIRIEMASLPEEQVRLPLVTITAPVRVNKDVLAAYPNAMF